MSGMADELVEGAMATLDRYKEEWCAYHLAKSGIIFTDRLGRFHRSQLEGISSTEQIKDGWTNLFLMDGKRELAHARYRWSDELRLEWEPA